MERLTTTGSRSCWLVCGVKNDWPIENRRNQASVWDQERQLIPRVNIDFSSTDYLAQNND